MEQTGRAIEEEDVIDVLGDGAKPGVAHACVIVVAVVGTLGGGVHRGGGVPTDRVDIARVVRAAGAGAPDEGCGESKQCSNGNSASDARGLHEYSLFNSSV